MAAALSHDFRSISRQPQPDPDIHATLSDFLTYTEHFPSHLTRGLTLIENQRARAEAQVKQIHNDTTTYSILPCIEHDRPDPARLRKSISHALEEAERACRMAVEEAAILDVTCKREAARLDVVLEKLRAQPLPPSRDPTPEQQQALTSPNLKRERRTSMRGEGIKVERPSRKLLDKAATHLRARKVTVPGEVLPPPDPNAVVESMSDWTSQRASSPVDEPETLKPEDKATPRPRSNTPGLLRLGNRDKKALKPRGPRAPGQPGTNAHSAVAGISTSNALLALTQPPEDAPKGSKWLPWMKLTEWEMAKLRKRMKKNAIWVPSQTMVRRELKNLGRGVAGREAARARANDGDDPFVDESTESDPTKFVISGEETAQINALLGNEQVYMDEAGDDADQELINRGMRLNEAKKLKRQRMLEEQRMQEEQALQAQIAREQGYEVELKAGPPNNKDGKKRKRDSTPSLLDTPESYFKQGPAQKKIKIAGPVSASSSGTSKVPLAPAGVSSSPRSSSRRAATPPAYGRKPTLILKAGKAVSEEPPNRRSGLRRASNASVTSNNATSPRPKLTSNNRRSRRPAPSILTTTSPDGESAKVGHSKRKAAPRKISSNTASSKSSLAIILPAEELDPDEEHYCLCGDVSWGAMIACDNEESCKREWFHLSCVGLVELPPRRTKWYCPECRKKLKVGLGTNGLVAPGVKVGGR